VRISNTVCAAATLLHALEDRNEEKGIASLCLGGGNAVGMAIRRI
jgi:acetyl-CoA acetyltransferase